MTSEALACHTRKAFKFAFGKSASQGEALVGLGDQFRDTTQRMGALLETGAVGCSLVFRSFFGCLVLHVIPLF